MNIQTLVTAPAVRRDPLRMGARWLMLKLERVAFARQMNQSTTRALAPNARINYFLRELLNESRYLYGTHEFLAASVFHSLIRPGMVVADVGANIGEYTVLAANRVGAQGRILAFEPNPEAFERLVGNVDLNGFSTVECFSFALSDRAHTGLLHVPKGELGLGSLREDQTGDEIAVEVRTLDSVVDNTTGGQLDVLKVDVEGFEEQVFKGSARVLTTSRPLVQFELGADTFYKVDGQLTTRTMRLLVNLGYQLYGVRMDRRHRWYLVEVSQCRDPRRFREPWEALTLIAIHPQSRFAGQKSGVSSVFHCRTLESLGLTLPRPHWLARLLMVYGTQTPATDGIGEGCRHRAMHPAYGAKSGGNG